MVVKSTDGGPSPPASLVDTVGEIMSLYRSLPPRPSIDEVEAAVSVVKSVKAEEQSKLEEISTHCCPPEVPEELFALLQQVRRTVSVFQSREQSREALHLVELDEMFESLDGLIQRASLLVSGDAAGKEKLAGVEEPVVRIGKVPGLVGRERKEDGELSTDEFAGLGRSSSSKATFFSGEVKSDEKLSLLKVAAVIENSAKSGVEFIDLRGKLMDQVEWLPVSIGKLSAVTELDLSENKIMALPPSIANLKAVTKLDLHSNQLMNLPDSFGELTSLTDLDLHANNLRSLPATIGNLKNMVNLDLSSNHFTSLPDAVGDLLKLKTLNAETNELEELPYTIGNCSSLTELRLDFNNLKGLPEAVGKLECLEILTLHYNRVKSLPTTMGNLLKLKEIDVSFNELEYIPESLCFAVQLKKINAGKNFADLRALPKSIGNLEMLEELDISDDQIRMLPDSFRLLSKLRVFHAHETPLEVPPREVCKLGAQAVVQYMADLVANKDSISSQSSKKEKGIWLRICLFCFPFFSSSK
ncbi:Plant intracellular Ras-group-related LRR protein 5 [Linum grandiflorum]